MADKLIDQARALFGLGQYRRGMDLLGKAAKSGNADALEMLAGMALAGQIMNRDLPLSRDLFRRAAETGSASAAATYRAFIAHGTGGLADWKKAVELVERAAGTDPQAERELQLISAMPLSHDGSPIGTYAGERLSDSPDAVMFRSLFTSDECDFLIECAMPALQPSKVIDPRTGELVPNPVRTSDAAGFPLMAERPAIHAFNRRLAAASGTQVGQGEPLQVLRYRPGQEYRPHFDAIANADNQRVLTFLVYLNDNYEGGETYFLSTGIKVKSRKGDGLLFRNADSAGRPDPSSQHAGLPVSAGEKLLASRWIRERPLQY